MGVKWGVIFVTRGNPLSVHWSISQTAAEYRRCLQLRSSVLPSQV